MTRDVVTWIQIDLRTCTAARDVLAGIAIARVRGALDGVCGLNEPEKDHLVGIVLAGGPLDAPDMLAAGGWAGAEIHYPRGSEPPEFDFTIFPLRTMREA